MTPDKSPPTDKPSDPPYPGGEDEDPVGSGEHVKEPPQPGKTGTREEFPRQGQR